MRRLIFGLLLIAVACGQPQAKPPTSPLAVASPSATATAGSGRSPSPSPLTQPTTSPSLLFAVLEAKGTASWNTVAIAGIDGYARAKTTFVPMGVPNVGCTGGAVPPPSAHVAAGRVYFADGTGVVRSLSVNGQITQVTTFPLTSGQQMLSFAVSPDGFSLLGAVFTLPTSPQLGCGGTPVVDGYSLDVYYAPAGGDSTLRYHESLLANLAAQRIDLGINVMALVGWDQVGPIATYPSEWVSQGGPRLKYRGTPVRVDSVIGRVSKQVSDPGSCYVQDIASSGDFVCSLGVNGDLSVRNPDGSETWRAASQPKNDYFLAFLSPDERRLVAVHASRSVTEVAEQDGSRVVLAGELGPEGWLDSATVIGINGAGNLTFLSLSAPGTLVDLGFKGQFVGTVRT
jgi:hypothetical protein